MNDERLNELKERAEKATRLASQIEALKGKPSQGFRNLDRCGNESLSSALQDEVWAAGLKAVIAAKEAELESLLNPPPAIPELPADNPAIWIAPFAPPGVVPQWMPPPNFDITGEPSTGNVPPLKPGEIRVTSGSVQCQDATGLTAS